VDILVCTFPRDRDDPVTLWGDQWSGAIDMSLLGYQPGVHAAVYGGVTSRHYPYGMVDCGITAIDATRWWQLDRAPAEHAQTDDNELFS
jgi:hypothetical protein